MIDGKNASKGPSTSLGPLLGERYELVELVGTGGMSEVWRARDSKLHRDVAVKVISDGAAHDAARRRRIGREAKAMAAVSHPNILAVYDYGEDERGHPYIVTEFVEGSDLHKTLATNGPFDVERTKDVMLGVLSGVQRAHEAGIVHGDLKPANVLVDPHGPKVGDFGVARILDEETGTTTIAATPSFAAPEVLKGDRATAASDVYSAACLAFQLLTGRPPYEGANGWEVAARHLEAPVPHVREFVDVPMDIDAAIYRGMSKEPSRRWESAAAFARALASAEATMPVAALGPTTEALGPRPDVEKIALFGPLWPWAKRVSSRFRNFKRPRPSLPALAVLVAFLVIIAVLAFASSGSSGVEVPDVRGDTVPEAVAALQQAGLRADISYRPITSGRAGVVVETVPAAGTNLAGGSRVHIVATALAVTPSPPPSREDDEEIFAPQKVERDHHDGKGGGRKGRGRD